MKPFLHLKTIPTPLFRSDIDTDLIIPADYLKTTQMTGLGLHLFERVREIRDPDFLEIDRRKGSQILVSRDNFGCGSSREHALWALLDFGYRAVIAPSFANIFYNNALNNGFLPIEISKEAVEVILEKTKADPTLTLEVNLENQSVVFDGENYEFEIEPYKKTCLLKGMTDLDYLLDHKSLIDDFFKKRAEINSWVNLEAL